MTHVRIDARNTDEVMVLRNTVSRNTVSRNIATYLSRQS